MPNKDIIIIGTGGHAKTVAEIVFSAGDNVVGFLTSDVDKKTYLDRPVLGTSQDYHLYNDCLFVIAIGDSLARESIVKSMTGAAWHTAVHPSAVVSSINTNIGAGTVVMANAVIGPYARIGEHCIINTSAIVEHDNHIDDYAHISVGATLAGSVEIGRHTCIGAGAVVSNGISVHNNCIVGAGAVVVKNIVSSGTYVGVPAKKIKNYYDEL